MHLRMIDRHNDNPGDIVFGELGANSFSRDVATSLVNEYADLVAHVTSPHLSSLSSEFAYGRLLGVRGSLCRICSLTQMQYLDKKTREKWKLSEYTLFTHLSEISKDDILYEAARNVEHNWANSIESFLKIISDKLLSNSVQDQLGVLKAIDSIALHLAQREIFHLSDQLKVPNSNAQAVKLRVRILALFVATQRVDFGSSYNAIRSYRETFNISDRKAYPWWFVDCNLTENQMNWTYRRLNNETLGWRF